MEPDPAIYNSTTAYPETIVAVVSDNHTFGYHIVTLKICPFEYIPANRILSIYTNIAITINYTLGEVKLTEKISERRHRLARDYVTAMVENPNTISTIEKTAKTIVSDPVHTDKLNLHFQPSDYGDIPDYIIITNELLKPYFETFATYKIKKGIPTLVVTVEQIYQDYSGCDKAEKIRNYIKATHQYWGDALFVLLGGDTAVIPERIGTKEGNYFRTTDMYYCDVYEVNNPAYNWNRDGDIDFGWDWGENLELGSDNFIGRAPVDTINETQNFINKIISYENLSGVSDLNYVNNLLFIGAYGRYPPTYDVYDDEGQDWHYNLDNKPFFDNVPYVNKWLLFDDYMTPGNPGPYNPNEFQGDEELNKLTTIDRLNNGHPINNKNFHIISHFDHGGAYGLGMSGLMKGDAFTRSDMSNLSNGSYYQIMYTASCESGEFEKDCIAERYINANNGGGVAILANSGYGYFFSRNQPVAFFESIYSNSMSNGHILGIASENTKYFTSNQNIIKNLTLFGEPTMEIWSATPQNIALNVPASITIDSTIDNELTASINILDEDASVTLYKFNNTTNEIEVYAEQIIAIGDTTATFVVHPDTEGELFVKVTAKNHLPATATVAIILPQAHLYITNTSFTDTNANGQIEQGESISLGIQLTNSGNTSITDIVANLSANPLFTNMTNAQAAYSSINAGSSAQLTGYTFDILVTEEIPPIIAFSLAITGSGGFSHTDTFYLDLNSPQIELSTRIITDNNGTSIDDFIVGEDVYVTIDLLNTGNVSASGLTATLTSPLTDNAIIEISSSDSLYPDILFSETETNTNTFVFKLLQTHSGEMPFTLTVENALGKTWSFDFDMCEELPPLIDGFDFISSRADITLMWNPVNDINGYTIYRSDAIGGDYIKINDYLVTGTSLYYDSDVEELSEYYYKISVVTLTGNELPKESLTANIAWTSLNRHEGFPIAADSNAASKALTPVTVCDVDGNGTKELFPTFSNGRDGIIMGFYESGQELYDIDGNQTTVSGFAEIVLPGGVDGGELWSKAAVGDIDNDGNAEVFVTTCGNYYAGTRGYLYGFHTTDSDGNSKPDEIWENDPKYLGHRSLNPPILADLDGDGIMEIIAPAEKNRLTVFDILGNEIWHKQPSTTRGPAIVAVADLDANGTKEIILGTQNNQGSVMGIYIWDYEGNDFSGFNPVYSSTSERFSTSLIIADIDNDNVQEIITIGRNQGVSKLYAFNPDGTFVSGMWNGQIDLQLPYLNHPIWGGIEKTPQAAVGDLDHDGFLEVVIADELNVYAFDRFGNILSGFPIAVGELNFGRTSPILADIDDDDDIEIIIKASNDRIYAFNNDGTECTGWRLRSGTPDGFAGTPTIADIDNDGYNEIIISDNLCITHIWKTTGDADKIEWGSYRANAQNTGVYKQECQFLEDKTIEINDANTVWTTDKHLQGNLIVKDNAKLTIHSKVTFTGASKIVVEPGAKLIIDGGILTNACTGLWQGIQVLGNSNLLQTEENQGVLEVKNGAIIEHAHKAIVVGIPELENSGGGIVRIDNSLFTDNIVGVSINLYRSFLNNLSYIRTSTFETVDYLDYVNEQPYSFVSLWNVNTITIEGNTFKNSPIEAYEYTQGKGIMAIDASFSLKPYCANPPCDEAEIIKNQFDNLNVAVEAQCTGRPITCHIEDNVFNKNLVAINLNSVDGATIYSNDIDVYVQVLYGGPVGMYISNSNGFHIENNTIYSDGYGLAIGMYINNCEAVNEIYRNNFTDLYAGIHSEGNNTAPIIDFPFYSEVVEGLEIICNDFTNVHYDIYVSPDSNIATHQGFKDISAGNIFLPECTGSYYEFYNHGNQVNYFKEDSPEYVPDCNYNVNLFTARQVNDCISKIPRRGNFHLAIASLDNEITSTQSELTAITDGGDTESLNETVDDAENTEALQLRNELLSKSPTLSDTVMVSTTNIESILPSLMVKQVLVANPKAAKSTKVQEALDDRQNQLPNYMRDEINLGKNILSYKEELESLLTTLKYQKEYLLNRKLIQLKQDATIQTLDTLENLLTEEAITKLHRNYQLVNYYMTYGSIQNAQSVFLAIPQNFDLLSNQQNEYNKLAQLFDIKINLENANQTWFDMDNSQKTIIETLAIDSTSTAGMQSRAVLSLVDHIDYGNYISDIVDVSENANTNRKMVVEVFKVYPEIATDYFIIEYVLGQDENLEEVNIAVFDNTGEKIKNLILKTAANQFLIECGDWKEGVYWCRKQNIKGAIIEQKVIINRGGMANDSIHLTSVQGANFLVLFPNPTNEYFFVSYDVKGVAETIVTAQITDSKGVKVGQYKLKDGLVRITTDSWQQGIYIVSIMSNDKLMDTAKIIVRQ